MSTTQAPSSQRITRRTLAPKQKRGHKRGTSEVGKFLHSLLRQEDTPKKKSGKKFHSLRLDSPTRELDAEALTSEERLSRLLHTPKPKIKLPEFGSLYDHFVVVGVPDHLAKSPKILFKFPPDSPVEIPGLPDFCFPGGIISSELPDSVCKSEMIGLLHNQQYLKQPKNSFVFLFTNQESQVYYGICVHKEEILEEPPQYMKDIFVPPSIRSTTTRCYCIITRFPFFRFHFEFLFSLFAVEHVTRLERSAPSILEEKEELDVFLSPSKSRVINQLSSDSISRSQTFPDKRRRNTNEVTSIKLNFEDLPKNIDEPQPEELPSPLLDELVTPRDGESTANNPIKRKEKKNRSCCLRKSSPGVLTQHITQTDKVVVQKIDHPCIKAMRSYRELPIPTKGQEIIFSASDYLSPFSFRRPFFDEEEELFAEWGLPVTLHMLSFETLCEFLSAILLEKKVLVYAESLRILSALVFAFPPLIKPFTYQSVIIPMLPDKMESFLEAPVPFVVGTTRDPSSPELEIPDDVVILNAAKNQLISGEPIAGLPQYDELNRKCSPFVQELLASFAGETPYSTTQVQRQLINSICTVFETHFDSLFANFHNYTICNKSDPSKPISVFMKDSFLDDIEEEELPFLEPFVASQAFFEYSDQRLRKRDNGE